MPVVKKAPTLRTNNADPVNDPEQLVGKTVDLDPREIKVTPNPRAAIYTDDDLKDMRDSLKRDGQWQNILIKPNTNRQNGDPRFLLVDGRRRHGGATMEVAGNGKMGVKANPDFRIRAFVMPANTGKGNADEVETFSVGYRVNQESRPMTPLDQANTYNVLRTIYKMDDTEARKAMGGFAASWSNVLQRLIKLRPAVREALEAGNLDARTAADTVLLDDAACARVLKAMVDGTGKVMKKLYSEAAADPSEKEKEAAAKEAAKEAKRAAKIKAQEEKKTARDAKKKGGEKLRGRSNKAQLRPALEIRGFFTQICASPGVDKRLKDFAMTMREYISLTCQEVKLWGAVLKLAGFSPEDNKLSADVPAGPNTAEKPKVAVKGNA